MDFERSLIYVVVGGADWFDILFRFKEKIEIFFPSRKKIKILFSYVIKVPEKMDMIFLLLIDPHLLSLVKAKSVFT